MSNRPPQYSSKITNASRMIPTGQRWTRAEVYHAPSIAVGARHKARMMDWVIVKPCWARPAFLKIAPTTLDQRIVLAELAMALAKGIRRKTC